MTACRRRLALVLAVGILLPTLGSPTRLEAAQDLQLTVSWGHTAPVARDFFVALSGTNLSVSAIRPVDLETDDSLREGHLRTRAGHGDVDGITGTLTFPELPVRAITNAHSLWRYLWDHGDPEAARRLQADPANRPDPRRLEVRLGQTGTPGFCLTVDQLLNQQTFWFPELDLFISSGTPRVSFTDHQAALRAREGQRVLDRVRREPEATYAAFTNRWEDMGSPAYANPHAIPPGHLVGLSWEGSRYKFGVDRAAGIRNDYGKADEFQLAIDLGETNAHGLLPYRQSQHLTDGLPVIVSTFLKDGLEAEVEQFVRPLADLATDLPGDAPMAFFQRVRVSPSRSEAGTRSLHLFLTRGREISMVPLPPNERGAVYSLVDEHGATLLLLEGHGLNSPVLLPAVTGPKPSAEGSARRHALKLSWSLAAGEAATFTVKLPAPRVAAADAEGLRRLRSLDVASSRDAVLAHWRAWLARGARFEVSEEVVNQLFRANLWHALRLPRRPAGTNSDPSRVDLPYSNFAYDQVGIPWPVNQAVYVDYMLYDLRGHHDLAAQELLAMFRANQEPNGHVGGFANWGVYTPGMLYSVGQHFLLSANRASFDRLLPASLRALDWCLDEIRRADGQPGTVAGLVNAPLNDLSHDALPWAFNQGYFVAGLTTFGQALERIGHPRAPLCARAAANLREAVEHEFARASARSPAVQLGDGSWIPFVPCHALASGRQFTLWYPTDVDTGSLHLPRLRALDPRGPLSTYLLHDHEDNLLFRQWGAINEPVYNMQGTAYLLRDEPEAAIRTFYTTMACAFSHCALEPVEHRWGWGQYFGPPSTDGAWFELYRNLLVRELDDDTLFLGSATPRAWLADGKHVEVRHAPTYFGPLDFRIDSEAHAGRLVATVDFTAAKHPRTLLVRLRHPERRPLQSVTVNGLPWTDFDPGKEWVKIPRPTQDHISIAATY